MKWKPQVNKVNKTLPVPATHIACPTTQRYVRFSQYSPASEVMLNLAHLTESIAHAETFAACPKASRSGNPRSLKGFRL